MLNETHPEKADRQRRIALEAAESRVGARLLHQQPHYALAVEEAGGAERRVGARGEPLVIIMYILYLLSIGCNTFPKLIFKFQLAGLFVISVRFFFWWLNS